VTNPFYLQARCFLGTVSVLLGLATSLPAQQTTGRIIGQVRILRADFPSERILVELEVRGAPMNSLYTDSEGRFGFYNLDPNPYHITINDDRYQPVRVLTVVNPLVMPTSIVEITLLPKASAQPESLAAKDRISGGNPNLVDVKDYAKKFPKPAVKEFVKGAEAERKGKRDEAIQHYQKAITLAPEFYPAHNNLGSAYISRSDFPAARQEFEQVVKLNPNDAAAYFNLANVALMTKQVPDAERFLAEGFKRQPDSALGKFLSGSLCAHSGKTQEAEHFLREAIQLDPAMAQARLQLVNLYLKEQRKEQAIAELRDFLKAFPDGPFSPKAKEVLQKLEAGSQVSSPR
jgi:Flp pilus assembly protein TadD